MFKKLYRRYRNLIIKKAESFKPEIEEETRLFHEQLKKEAAEEMKKYWVKEKISCVHIDCEVPWGEDCIAKFEGLNIDDIKKQIEIWTYTQMIKKL